MVGYETLIAELARQRDLVRSVDQLVEWQRLRSEIFTSLMRVRRTLADEQTTFLAALRAGHHTRTTSVEILQICRTLREMLAEADARIGKLLSS